ncbi:MAG: sigma 54-dependent Fis family transcriptional regulator [Sandaracinaceae bacterium]
MSVTRTHTIDFDDEISLPIQAIKVTVIEGPQKGAVAETEEERVQIGTAEGNDLVLDDDTVSRYHVELVRKPDGIHLVDHDSRNGTYIGALRVEKAVVPVGTKLKIGRTVVEIADGARTSVDLHDAELGPMLGGTPSMRRLFAQVRKAAASDIPVLLVGESGTGKELVARSLHAESPRKDGPFVVVDCASLSPTLIASELFGHEKGAFTGADRRHAGAFERADGGTLFLDEIGKLPAELQPNLLGVLERRRFRRLGGREEIATDVRVVSATNRDLRAEVNAGTFRLDLYYRIAVVRLPIPALRERPEDIPRLIERFLREAGEARELGEVVPASMMANLALHRWPGNVRELRNWVEATVAMGEAPPLDDTLGLGHGVEDAEGGSRSFGPLLALPYKDARAALLQQFEAAYLPHVLERAEGNVSQAARDCGMDRSHLWDLLRRHGLR